MVGWITSAVSLIKEGYKMFFIFKNNRNIEKRLKVEKVLIGSSSIAMYIKFENPTFSNLAIEEIFIDYDTFDKATEELSRYKSIAHQINEVALVGDDKYHEKRFMFTFKTNFNKYTFDKGENKDLSLETFPLKKQIPPKTTEHGWIVFGIEVKGFGFFDMTIIEKVAFKIYGKDKIFYTEIPRIKNKFMDLKNNSFY